ncbi:AI-2E family transporter [Crocosphaera chwakensis]|uniref:Permease n=1 Tax=Crocosphaera chwakensis CCY0110 TaxID=391612 RepID=A3IL53_9CHRO|nr:AI-2E family transporter [Crocosphaera chwakensis]EAZ92922.1 hypothetical protein CY0110_22537 [Crocosphaera chwakensis CCY0110]
MSSHYPNQIKNSSWLFYGLIFPIVVLNIIVFIFVFQQFKSVFYSFTIASFLALLLHHPIIFLEKKLGLSKLYAILLVFLSFTLIFSVIGIILVPIIVIKFSALLSILPDWIQSTSIKINNISYWFNSNNSLVDSQTIITKLTDSFQDQLQNFIQGFPNFIFGTIGNLLSIFLIAVLTIFFLFYGNSFLKNCLHSWFSSDVGEMIHKTLYRNFNSYLLNQVVLSTVLTIVMIPTLYLLKAPFALLFGLTIGAFGLVPFGATLSILAVSIILFLGNIWIGLRVLLVLIIIDQIIENILPPRLLGKLTGLNPIIILFSVMVGATLGDFVGLITAVPIAATTKSLFNHWSQSNTQELEKIFSQSS